MNALSPPAIACRQKATGNRMSTATQRCPNCNNYVERDDKRCPYCGQELFHGPGRKRTRRRDKSHATKAAQQCRNCGNPLSSTDNVCPYCRRPTHLRLEREPAPSPASIKELFLSISGLVAIVLLMASIGLLTFNFIVGSFKQAAIAIGLIVVAVLMISFVRSFKPPI